MFIRWLEKITVAAAAAAVLSGCATIIGKGGPQMVVLSSDPDRAQVTVQDAATGFVVYRGATPTQVYLLKRAGFFRGKSYVVTFQKPGYQSLQVPIHCRTNGWYVTGNLFFGGLIGWLIIDPASGAMWALSPEQVEGRLEPKRAKGAPAEIRVSLLEEVPAALRSQMTLLTRGAEGAHP
ncbi:MAG: hypothetical protein HY548_05040 [Elusimicrobia bacterium]|nr:hypothetical protein [Elusimicrobiota bacterium]